MFPTLVYICPGIHQCPGGTFNYKAVTCLEEVKEAAESGYYPTLPLAQEKPDNFDWKEYLDSVYEEVEETSKDEDPDRGPTREELEEKAKELQIGFNKNTKNETLLQKINDALAEQE